MRAQINHKYREMLMRSTNYENAMRVTTNLTFGWTRFYHELADKLLAHQEDRTYLVEAFHDHRSVQ